MINIFEIISWKMMLVYVAFINIFSFVVFFLDKFYAKKGKWRISEKTLLISALLGGTVGALLGMKIFRHKIRKKRFSIGIPIILITQILLITYYLLKLNNII